MLRPWHAAGVLHLWPDPDAPDLAPEIAALLQRSERSIRRDWQKARLFLLSAMSED